MIDTDQQLQDKKQEISNQNGVLKKSDLYFLDFRSNYNYQNPDKFRVLPTLLAMRADIDANRQGKISYCIALDPGVHIADKNDDAKMDSQANDFYIVTLSRSSLYPSEFENGQNYKIIRLRNKTSEELLIPSKNYTFYYHLSDVFGILVAQQLRFNTFELVSDYFKPIIGTLSHYETLVRNYQISYKNWQSQKNLDDQVQIRLRHPSNLKK